MTDEIGAKKKYVGPKCPRGKLKTYCGECGGGSICEHGRRKSVCKECGGASICEHWREQCKCKECGGCSFCEHRRWKPDAQIAMDHINAELTENRIIQVVEH